MTLKQRLTSLHNCIDHNLVHGRTKHIEIDKHFIKDHYDRSLVVKTYVPTEL